MAKIQSNAKRVLAIVLSLMMVFGACFTGMVTASAESLVDGLTNPASASENACTRTNATFTVTDLVEGSTEQGVLISYAHPNSVTANTTYAHKENAGTIYGNTVTLQFNNFVVDLDNAASDKVGYKCFQIIFSSSFADYYCRLTGGVPALRIDTANGKLEFVKGTNNGCGGAQVMATVAEDTALLYDNITGKPFTVSFTAGEDYSSDITVTVVIDGTTTVSGKIPATAMATEPDILDENHNGYGNSLGKCPTTATYFSIGGTTSNENSNQPFSIEYYGFKTEKAPFKAGLTTGITNVATAALTGYAASANISTFTDLSGGGVHVSFAHSSSYYQYIHNVDIGAFLNNNYRLQFANYKSTATNTEVFGYRQFAIGLARTSTSSDTTRKIFKQAHGIRFDTVNGKIDLIEGCNSANSVLSKYDIITDAALLYDNFTGHAFTVDFYNSTDSIDIVVTIADYDENGDKVLKGSIPLDVYKTELTYPLTTSYGFFTVSGIEHNQGSNPWSVEYYGWKSGLSPLAPSNIENAEVDVVATSADNKYSKNQIALTDYVNTAGAANGVKVKYTYGAYNPFVYGVNLGTWPAFTEGGFELHFANYVENSATSYKGYGKLVFQFSNTCTDANFALFKSNQRGIVINTVDGTVEFAISVCEGMLSYRKHAVLIEDEAFKYANFTGKAFSLAFTNSTRTGTSNEVQLDITITEADGTENVYTAYIPYEYMTVDVSSEYADKAHSDYCCTASNYSATKTNNFPSAASATYLSFGPTYNAASNTYLDFVGYSTIKPAYLEGVENFVSIADAYPNYAMSSGEYIPVRWGMISDIEGGGVHMNYNQNAGFAPYVPNVNFGGYAGGFKLQFNNFVDNTADDIIGKGHLMLTMMSSVQSSYNIYKLVNNVFALDIDTNTGKVQLVQGTSGDCTTMRVLQEIIVNDAFKYENFTGKSFSVTMKKSGQGNLVDLTVEVAGTEYKGLLNADLFKEIYTTNGQTAYAPTASSMYIGVGSGLNNAATKFAVDFYGYTTGIKADYESNVGTEATTEDQAVYYTNKDGSPATHMLTTDISTGINISYDTMSAYYPFIINNDFGAFPGNGITLNLANYISTAATENRGYRMFAINLIRTIGTDSEYKLKPGVGAIVFDTVNGKIELIESTGSMISYDVVQTIIEDEAIRYDNITGRAITVSFLPNGDDANVSLVVKVGDKTLTGTILRKNLDTIDKCPTGVTYLSVSGIDNDGAYANKWSIDLLGYTVNAGSLNVGSVIADADTEATVPVYVTSNGVKTMTVKVTGDVTALEAADGFTATAIDANTVKLTAAADVAGTGVLALNVKTTAGASGSVKAIAAEVVEAKNAAGDKLYIGASKGAVLAATADAKPDADNRKYQAKEGTYQIGTLGFGTDLTGIASQISEDMVAVEYGTVFFTKKMLGAQELKMGTGHHNGGAAKALTVSKAIAAGEELPDQFVAVLKDKTDVTGTEVSEAYKNTTFVARSFVRFYNQAEGVYVMVYGDTFEARTSVLEAANNN